MEQLHEAKQKSVFAQANLLIIARGRWAVSLTIISLITIAFASVRVEAQSNDCKIRLRLIRAVRNGATEADLAKERSRQTPAPKMASFLQDVSAQLASLPFSEYERIAEAEHNLTFEEKGSYVLKEPSGEEHSVSVTPHKCHAGRVHLTVDWQDGDGGEVLSTKMKVDNGKNVMLGTDKTNESSTLIGVKVDCDEGTAKAGR